MGSKSRRRDKSKPKRLWTGMSAKFEGKLHPELARRVKFVMQDLFDLGWEPVIAEVYGREGTGYRSVKEQAEILLLTPDRTRVSFSFHNVTDAAGKPQSMAVHVFDRNQRENLNREDNDPFLGDLEMISERHGLHTGNSWVDFWDPRHVQLYDKSTPLKRIKKGDRPPFLDSKLVLLTPHLRFNPSPSYLPPRTLDNFLAGERFILQNNYPSNNLFRRFNGLRDMFALSRNPFPNLSLVNDTSPLILP